MCLLFQALNLNSDLKVLSKGLDTARDIGLPHISTSRAPSHITFTQFWILSQHSSTIMIQWIFIIWFLHKNYRVLYSKSYNDKNLMFVYWFSITRNEMAGITSSSRLDAASEILNMRVMHLIHYTFSFPDILAVLPLELLVESSENLSSATCWSSFSTSLGPRSESLNCLM